MQRERLEGEIVSQYGISLGTRQTHIVITVGAERPGHP
jgi:hypothetical protein